MLRREHEHASTRESLGQMLASFDTTRPSGESVALPHAAETLPHTSHPTVDNSTG